MIIYESEGDIKMYHFQVFLTHLTPHSAILSYIAQVLLHGYFWHTVVKDTKFNYPATSNGVPCISFGVFMDC